MELHRTTKGIIGESLVTVKLLEHNLEVFAAVSDIDGVDFAVRAKGGGFLEVQVKGVHTERYPEWFQLTTTRNLDDMRKRPYFVVGMTTQREFWVFPPEIFFNPEFSNICTNEKGLTTVDLNLAITRRGNEEPNRERLRQFKDNWQLLIDRSLATTSNG